MMDGKCPYCGRPSCDCTPLPVVEDKRELQKKQAWIRNVMRIEGLTEELAEDAYNRIFNNEIRNITR